MRKPSVIGGKQPLSEEPRGGYDDVVAVVTQAVSVTVVLAQPVSVGKWAEKK